MIKSIITSYRTLLLAFILVSNFSSCRKADTEIVLVQKTDTKKGENKTVKRFLTLPQNIDTAIRRVAAQIGRENDRSGFLENFIKTRGFAVWDKALIKTTKNKQRSTSANQDYEVLIPLVIKDSIAVYSALACKVTGDSVYIQLLDARLYKQPNADSSFKGLKGRKLSLALMMLNKEVFGHELFEVKDSAAFEGLGSKVKFVRLSKTSTRPNIAEKLIPYTVQICYTIMVPASQGQLVGCPPGGPCPQYVETTRCDSYSGFYDDGNYGGGTPTPPGTPGGGGGGSYTDPPLNPCDPVAVPRATQARLVPCEGGTGWVPAGGAYAALTAEERADLDVLIAEEQIADNSVVNPSPCHGTARLGNIFFQGTMEHWLVQLDYLSKNPFNSDREYAIPGAGPSGGYGFADIVNTTSKEIFEIKPLSQTAAGITEVGNYVIKANVSCLNSGTPGVPWIKGYSAGYTPRHLPWPKDPSRTLYASSTNNGVINYDLIQRITFPNPIIIPQTIVDKIKNLLQRLHQYPGNIEYEIAIFLKDPNNADVLQAIQGALVGSAIAIVVGTIIEDVITAGVGIADDWACFMLAYKLVRVARIL